MSNLLRRGMKWLTRKLKQHASETVTYSRGAQSVEIRAPIGKTLMRLDDGYGGVRMEWTDEDFLIPAADLVLGGSTTLPQRGDRIRWTVEGVTYVFEVMAPGNEPPWRWSDEHRTMLRVHCKQVGTE